MAHVMTDRWKIIYVMVKAYMSGRVVINMKGIGDMEKCMEKAKWYGQMDRNTRDNF